MAQKDEDQLARIAAKQLTGEAPKENSEPAKDATPQEQAAQVASPQTEGDKTQEAAVMYKIKMGDKERELTPQQISSTFERYRDLNHKQSQMKPVMDLAEKMMSAGNIDGGTAAKLMEASMKSYTKNVQMGRATQQPQAGTAKPEQPSPNATQPNLDKEFQKYEDDNAISLPPGYREAAARLNAMEQRLGQGMQMLNQMTQRMGQQAQQGVQSAQQAQGDRMDAIRQTIENNLNSAQQAAGLPDEAVTDFQAYAGERGYTAEDFADSQLTMKVVQDFANQRNTPEFQRLKDMSSRRQAFLQTQQGSPAAPAAKPTGDDTMARMAAKALAGRNQ